MTIRQEMLRAAARAIDLLGPSAQKVASFLRSRMNPDGGFQDRAGKSDLYYAAFALQGLAALGAETPRAAVEYVAGFGAGERLDLVHLACLARCHATLGCSACPEAVRTRLVEAVERHRTPDGGYNLSPSARFGAAYCCFLALGAYQDLRAELPRPQPVRESVQSLRAIDGGYANERGLPVGATAATAAAVCALLHLGVPADPSAGQWLLARRGPDGGFGAFDGAPGDDLLSTAVAVHALAVLGADLGAARRPCIEFVMDLQCADGGFRGHRADDAPDCEYTFYALLALGHLSPQP